MDDTLRETVDSIASELKKIREVLEAMHNGNQPSQPSQPSQPAQPAPSYYLTHDEVTAYALYLVRRNPDYKSAIVNTLKDFNATTLKDLKAVDLFDFLTAIKKVEAEVGK